MLKMIPVTNNSVNETKDVIKSELRSALQVHDPSGQCLSDGWKLPTDIAHALMYFYYHVHIVPFQVASQQYS